MSEIKIQESGPDWIKERIRQYWNQPETRSSNTSRMPTDGEEQACKAFFSEKLGPEKKTVLDVGTGIGFLALPLAELGHKVVAIDLAEGMILQARERAEERGLRIEFRTGDAETLDLEDQSFDAVVSRWVLWTLPNPHKAVIEWSRVLKSDGKIYAFTTDLSLEAKQGPYKWCRTNFSKLLISLTERRNAWIQSYDKNVSKVLPRANTNNGSWVANVVKIFKDCGLSEVMADQMEEVSREARLKSRSLPFRYKITWNGHARDFVCVSGRKPEKVS